MNKLDLQVDAVQLIKELSLLAEFSNCSEPQPAVTRMVFTPTDLKARAYLESLYKAAGLKFRVDAIGNTFARWEGTDPHLSVVGTGSHTDAIPHAGMYDGTVGVLGGLEAIRALQRSRFQPRRSIELVMTTSEEPTRFGVGCTGSRAMAGLMGEVEFQMLRDSEEKSYDTVRKEAGFSGSIADTHLSKGYFHKWVELHIEQGPSLEAANIPIGIVTAIAAPATLHFALTGAGGHAGGVLMPARRDALCAAAEIILAIENVAKSSHSGDLVATVGKLEIHPGATNSIASKVKFTLDLRDIELATRDQALQAILEQVSQITLRRNIQMSHETLNADAPAASDKSIIDTIAQVCREQQLPSQEMISRAYHDSLFIARIAPIGMIFIPCRGGVSHRPDEYSSPEQIVTGTTVLAHTLAELAK